MKRANRVFMKPQPCEPKLSAAKLAQQFMVKAVQYVAAFVAAVLVVFLALNYVTAGTEVHLDEYGECEKVVEIPAFGDPVKRPCPPDYKLLGEYVIITPKKNK